jgi:hypothetical protein
MTVEVENTGAAVDFLDPECLCSTTLIITDNTLASSVSYMRNAFKLSQYELLDCSGDRSEAVDGLLS